MYTRGQKTILIEQIKGPKVKHRLAQTRVKNPKRDQRSNSFAFVSLANPDFTPKAPEFEQSSSDGQEGSKRENERKSERNRNDNSRAKRGMDGGERGAGH